MSAIESVAARVATRRPTRAEALLGWLLLVAVPYWIVTLEPIRPWLIAFAAAGALITVGAAAELRVPAGDRTDGTISRWLVAVVVLASLVLARHRLPAALTANVGLGIQLAAAVGVWSRLLLARWLPDAR
ncbi:hypothetical protein [Saliphagus infecundisoli]|uniref:SPW repeat-containing protein n=1 Tax=Saliphagus infecundisoli TaxID=1849069 RepID=A0ABD5Q9Z4_9EURY|nr:hypothetical protein [Saliphagus infecundisoli]